MGLCWFDTDLGSIPSVSSEEALPVAPWWTEHGSCHSASVYKTRAQARLDLIDWIEGFYNAQRVHSSIEYQSPSMFEKHLQAA